MNIYWKFGPWLAAALLLVTTVEAHAARFFSDLQVLGRLGVGNYDWKDFNSLGNEIGSESGSWMSFNLTANNFYRKTSGVIYGMDLEQTGGYGDYFGDAWSGVVVPPSDVATTNAKTISSSLNVGALGGYRLVLGPFGFNALAGASYYQLGRTIKNGRSTTGTFTYGHDENISFMGFRLSGGIDLTLGRFRLALTAGSMLADGKRDLTLDIPTSQDTVDGEAGTKYHTFAGLNSSMALDGSGRHRIELNAYSRRFKTKAESQMYVSPRGTGYFMPGAEASTSVLQIGYGYTF